MPLDSLVADASQLVQRFRRKPYTRGVATFSCGGNELKRLRFMDARFRAMPCLTQTGSMLPAHSRFMQDGDARDGPPLRGNSDPLEASPDRRYPRTVQFRPARRSSCGRPVLASSELPRSFGANVGFLDDRLPASEIVPGQFAELCRRTAEGGEPLLFQGAADIRHGQHLDHVPVDLLDNIVRRPGRRVGAVPHIDIDVLEAGRFGERGRVRGDETALKASRRKQAKLSGLSLRQDLVNGHEADADLAADQISERASRAFVGYVLEIDAGFLLDQFHGQMVGRANSGRGIVDFARCGFGELHDVPEVLHRKARCGDQRQAADRELADRREVLVGIEAHVWKEARRHRDGIRGHQQRVAIRRGRRCCLGTDIAAGARPVFDDHRNVPFVRKTLSRGSVSYTHLDVYKRQPMTRLSDADTSSNCSRTGGCLTSSKSATGL